MGAKRQAKKEFAKEQELAKLRAKQAQREVTQAAAKRRAAERTAAAAAERQRRRSAMTPQQRTAEDRRELIVGLLVMVLVVLGVGGCVVLAFTSDSGDDGERTESTERSPTPDEVEEADQYLGFDACKTFVDRYFDGLGAASDRAYADPFEDDGEVRFDVDGDEVTIESQVDIETFGGEERWYFTCTARDSGDEWVRVDLDVVPA